MTPFSRLKTFSLLVLLTVSVSGRAQEILTGLPQNPALVKQAQQALRGKSSTDITVKLPFVEDFSNYTGFPDSRLWVDRQGFVNNTYPIYPPTIGVVTLDALDEDGKIYAHADRDVFSADTLTSVKIRLDSNFTKRRKMNVGDSLYFSFYYQPGGGSKSYPTQAWERIGDAPEQNDKLFLEFGYATGDTIFIGLQYGEYILADDEHYVAGDSIENPFMPGTYYHFDHTTSVNEVILMPMDSLWGPEYVWNEVWSSNGCELDTWLAVNSLDYFKQVLIPITDEQYLRNNFQFRFRNLASLDLDSWSGNNITGWASNCDQWHIDYIRLDADRTQNDLYPTDVSFVSPSTSALSQYQSMPWSQFRESDMAASFSNDLSNLSSTTRNTFYNYRVEKEDGSLVFQLPTKNSNAPSYYNNGLVTYPDHATPDIEFSFPRDNADSAAFTVSHIFRMEGTADARTCNDTFQFRQEFYNYYAYDDGTAEAGYCLLSTLSSPEASLAVQFTLAQPDTLRCVKMWFNRTFNDENVEPFTLMVWADDNGRPGDILYSQEAQLPAFADNFLDFIPYTLDTPVFVEGTFYVGFYQNHNVQLNLGFDQNNDARGHFFYKTAGTWNESFYKGAPMVRPVIGKALVAYDVPDINSPDITLYPNPTLGSVRINGVEDAANLQWQIFDLHGKLLVSKSGSADIDLSSLAPGLYLVKVMTGKQIITTKKIIKQ